LLELKQEEIEGDKINRLNLYRKTPLFDRFCSFDVTLDGVDSHRH